MMLEFRYDTQLLIEGENLDEDAINDYFTENFKGDCLLAVGDEELIYCTILLEYTKDSLSHQRALEGLRILRRSW